MKRNGHRLLPIFFISVALTFAQTEKKEQYQLIGTILQDDGKPFRGVTPIIFLEGVTVPLAVHTLVDRAGKFKFKNLIPGMFTLVAYIPRAGEKMQTVEVSRSLADKNGRIFLDIVFQRNVTSTSLNEISTVELSIPNKAKKEYSKSREKLAKQDVQGAIAHLKKAVEFAPQFSDAWNKLGTLAYQAGDYALAESYFRSALKHDPDYYPSLVNLGGALLSQHKIQEALPLNLEAVKARPDDALAQSQLGLNYFFLKKFDEAENYLKRAVILDPGHFSYPQLVLAEIYLLRKDDASLARELEQFLRLHPDAEQAATIQKRLAEVLLRLHSDKSP